MKTVSMEKQKKRSFTFRQIVEGLEGVAIIIACFLTPFLRSRRARWGASTEEIDQIFPADEIVSNPNVGFIHAVNVNAPAKAVFPWIAQIGQGRGGFYSYEALENIAGMNVYNSEEIIPEYQNPKLGDLIPFTANDSYPLVVCEKNKAMAIGLCLDMDTQKYVSAESNLPANYLKITWLWCVKFTGKNRCRFYSRNRLAFPPTFKNKVLIKWLVEPVSFAMDRKMCLGIKKRAEKYFQGQGESG